MFELVEATARENQEENDGKLTALQREFVQRLRVGMSSTKSHIISIMIRKIDTLMVGMLAFSGDKITVTELEGTSVCHL